MDCAPATGEGWVVITRDDDQAGWSVYAMDAAKDTAARDKGRAAYQDFLTFLGASGQAG
jgi:hypothetical protein